MKRPIHQLIESKRQWHHQPSTDELALGFKGWHSRGYLPHFDAPGVRQFVSYRLADALPAERREEWQRLLALQDEREKFRRIEAYLDRGFGACYLRNHQVAAVVQENLLHFNGTRYELLGWCVMPNHVHVVVEVWDVPLERLVQGWKSYTARRANGPFGLAGTFWQPEYFDRYIRDEDHLKRAISYVENNPVKARLCRSSVEWPWSSARFRDAYCRLKTAGARTAPSARTENRNSTI